MLIVKMLVNTGRQKEKKKTKQMHSFPTVNWTHTHTIVGLYYILSNTDSMLWSINIIWGFIFTGYLSFIISVYHVLYHSSVLLGLKSTHTVDTRVRLVEKMEDTLKILLF